MVIAVDAVGGDHYPKSPVEGAIQAVKENEQLRIVLLGPEELINKELDQRSYSGQQISVHHAPDIVGMNESPSQAIKTKQNSSIAVGLGMIKAEKCNGFISAGNTGALLAASTFILGKLEGVLRPTIATSYPTVNGIRLLMDAGANLEMRPEMYAQFGHMGCIYAEHVMGIDNPKVGLLNVGEEEKKGTEVVRQAHQLLKQQPFFAGNIEGRDMLFGKVDVFLCDGFVGNILLKFGETIPDALQHILKNTFQQLEVSEEDQYKIIKVLKTALAGFNYETVGGVPFLGVNGVSMVGHGGSSPLAIKNMILNAVKCVEHNINDKIIASLK